MNQLPPSVNPNVPLIVREKASLPLPEKVKITVGIPTKNRYDSLSHTLLSIAFQTYTPIEVIIVDDTPEPINLTTLPLYEYVFKLLDEKKIEWKVIFGKKQGQHHSHQFIQEVAKGDLIFRIDDDEIAQPDVLEKLVPMMTKGVGAVAPCVMLPNSERLPMGLENTIATIGSPNIQWYKWGGVKDAEHLYSCFLYRKGIARYELSLSNKAHREETIFSYSIKRAGYNLLVNGYARVWHWRMPNGGIRSDNNEQDYHHDEGVFNSLLSIWGVAKEESKMIVLDCGLGDHWAFKTLLPELTKKYPKITIAACFPDVFYDYPDIKLISIADAKMIYGDINAFQVYRYLWEWNDKGEKMHLIDGFRKLYLNENSNIPLQQEVKGQEHTSSKKLSFRKMEGIDTTT